MKSLRNLTEPPLKSIKSPFQLFTSTQSIQITLKITFHPLLDHIKPPFPSVKPPFCAAFSPQGTPPPAFPGLRRHCLQRPPQRGRQRDHDLPRRGGRVHLGTGMIYPICSMYSIFAFTGWWFGTFFIFPYIGNNHPNWLIFFRGVQTTNQIFTFTTGSFIGEMLVNIPAPWSIWVPTLAYLEDLIPPNKLG